MIAFELERYFIMAIGFAMAAIEYLIYSKTKEPRKILYIFIGLFWGIFMLLSIVILGPWDDLNLIIGRSGTLLSISIIFGNSLRTYRRIK